MPDDPSLEVFYDGACPICSREMALVRKLDRQRSVVFTDMTRSDFDARARGLDPGRIHLEIHARLEDGTVVTGVEVFRRIYSLVGFRRLVNWSRWPWVSALFEVSYAAFAKHRRALSLPLRWLKR